MGVEFELSWSFLSKFDGTAKFVAKILVGIGSLCIFVVVHDWNCLISSLVIQRSHLTCIFVADTLYMAFIYIYMSLAWSYVVFNCLYVEHTCLCGACALCPLSTSFIRHV